MATSAEATSLFDLTDLIASNGNASTVYPSEDALLTALQSRFRADLPYTRLGQSTLVLVNPLKLLANSNDASATEYLEKCYKDVADPSAAARLQPHIYELAARVYLMMRRRNESQSVVFRGITGSGKSYGARLFSSQILRLSTHSKREARLAECIRAFTTLLESFGHAKTHANPSASRHGRYTELHFSEKGRISAAKVLTFGLDKSRLVRLAHEERSFHVFYQLLAGATPEEREALGLEDPSDYALLASSGCYRLPGGPFSDDSIAMDELRAAMKVLGFKAKHVTAIFSLLVAILLLSNIDFVDNDAREQPAQVVNYSTLERVAALLGVHFEDLEQALTNKTRYVRKELYTVFLTADGAITQRDHLVQDLYAILFAYVVETANHKVAPPPDAPPSAAPPTQIITFDYPGFQSRAPTGSMGFAGPSPLIAAYGQNRFNEFAINFASELVHSYVIRNAFEDNVGYNARVVSDGVAIPLIQTMDNSGCIELLRGVGLGDSAQRKPAGLLGLMAKASAASKQGKSSENEDEDLLREMVTQFGSHASFVANPSGGQQAPLTSRGMFGINHYAGNCTYDIKGFVECDADMIDSAFVQLLRGSAEGFVAKLVSGPSLAVETHGMDQQTVVQAQVSSRPLRQATPIFGPDGSLVSQDSSSSGLDPEKVYPITTQLNANIVELFDSLDRTRIWDVACVRPNDSGSPNSFDKRRVKSQIRSLLLTDLVPRRQAEYVADVEIEEFCARYAPSTGYESGSAVDRVRGLARGYGWREGIDYAVGSHMVWMAYPAWKTVEDVLRAEEKEQRRAAREGGAAVDDDESMMPDYPDDDRTVDYGDARRGFVAGNNNSGDNLLRQDGTGAGQQGQGQGGQGQARGYYEGGYLSPRYGSGQGPTSPRATDSEGPFRDPEPAAGLGGWGSEYDKAPTGTPPQSQTNLVPATKEGGDMKSKAPQTVEEVPISGARKWWVRFVWFLTWWIPDFALVHCGRMKRPDVRFAWREKVSICALIFSFCGMIIFYIIFFGPLLCPNMNKAWNLSQLSQHSTDNDFWVAVHGSVYDLTTFWRGQHSDIPNTPVTPDVMRSLSGQDLTGYFPVPLDVGCPGLVTNAQLSLQSATFVPQVDYAVHTSGALQANTGSALHNESWYEYTFLPAIGQYYKGPLVFDTNQVLSQGQSTDSPRNWAIWNDWIYDLSDYFNTLTVRGNDPSVAFLPTTVSDLFRQQAGQDITAPMNAALDKLGEPTRSQVYQCLKNNFYVGMTDFRNTPRCEVQNYMLLGFSALLFTTILAKFLAALQLTSKRMPEMLDKFVICQVPCYTEGEESLRRTIDSLAGLNYDDKRKLIFVICDGNIIGSGNDKTTPRIVLDILGVDPKVDPEPLMFKSIAEGSKQLNYGKVYSGLYEHEGHVVPYLVVVKVGKPSERSKPGNRGKRDSQILLLHYLNRVHFDAPMSPLELEIYHQMRNVIGIDPAFYEYIFMVDADTSVTPDSLNRLVACTADDQAIIAICGETKIDNEDTSWWTMIQVYEYYISHHLSKAFESLFGSVTCLPGCFSMYRVRTADKGRPLIISSRIIDDYSEGIVDTLHKKNLFSLGEDRYLTTLMMKHFPTFKMKFTPDAVAHTVAPDKWSVLLSQRRRWINSTIHNLVELVFLPDLCGFCCFSMRFIVLIDLLGTIILPATAVYLVYLIVTVATGQAPIPIISIAMLAAVYGFQVVIFLLKREFMLVGWLIIYLLAYPIYSFFLPLYSFWCMDDFSWGNTRLVVGEGTNKKIIMDDDEKFDDSMIPLKKFSEYEAETWETGSQRSGETRRTGETQGGKQQYSRPPTVHSTAQSYHPASQSGDFYRDTNLMYNASANPSMQLPHMQPQMTGMTGHQFGANPSLPQLPFLPFGGGPGSVHGGSDYGGVPMGGGPGVAYHATGGSYQGGFPMGMPGPRNTVMTNFNMFGGGGGAGSLYNGVGGPGMPMGGGGLGLGGGQRPMSTFSMATTMNPMASAGPSQNPDPTDDELLAFLRHYLSTQDLMTVTKKTAREAVMAQFPAADLTPRKDFLNRSIDTILSA
ncbi:glycosyltransferase family 2 protein [Botryobasidium botryosum FD-172 SS1]|uniref:chitin synthase n=1 Tax=Botryobasidium botryosum (strain FD-172 SS1) TaxID=930990 RepID=A0A067MLC3_BOTB1|nr:glycosyltransferase family 2 protein [Botryobasidium botryosum FD-172 SS1]